MKHFLFLSYLFISIILLANFHANFWVWVTFLLSWFSLSIIFIYHLYFEKTFSPFLSAFLVFNFLFFFIAPIIQINSFYGISSPFFSNHFPYKKDLVIQANLLIIFFNTVFFVSYVLLKKSFLKKAKIFPKIESKELPLVIIVLLVISVAIAFLTYNYNMELFIKPAWQKTSYSKMTSLLLGKTLYFLPLAGVILSYYYLKKFKPYKNYNFIFISFSLLIFILLLLWFKNPLTEKRNALGPIYITLIFLFFPKLLDTNLKYLSFLFFSMVIIFPLISVITHIQIPITVLAKKPDLLWLHLKHTNLLETFHTLHYDAYSSFLVSMEYIQKYGLSFGHQLLSTVLFFIPRSLWSDKPYSSGTMIGNYLIENYNFNFSNLSNPFISEFYLNFGSLGILIGAIIFAYIIVFMLNWLRSENILKKMLAFYFSLHILFLLRGDLTNGTVYYIGVVIALLGIIRLIYNFLNILKFKLYA